VTGTAYIRELLYRTGMLARDIAGVVTEDCRHLVKTRRVLRDAYGDVERDADGNPKTEAVYYKPSDCVVYCDPARPEGIAELRTIYGISAVPAINQDKTGRIGWMQGLRVKYVGEHIRNEVVAYSWTPDPHDSSRYTDTPQDGNDHILDASNYALFTHLHRVGLAGASTTIENK
jgi:hypothetical protein